MEKDEQSSRRKFLKVGMLTAASAGVAAAGLGFKKLSAEEKVHELTGKRVMMLSTDGELVAVDSSHLNYEHKALVSNEEARIGIAGKKFVMVIDLAKCDGCGKCTDACNKMHFIPPTKKWIDVVNMQDAPAEAPYYFPKPCFHCDDPPCTKVCPVDATFKREDGIVGIDNDRCIGCRFCMAACPYSVRVFNWSEPVKPTVTEINNSVEHVFQSKKGCVEKCDFCPHMARENKLPACVTGCPMDAIYFGDENEDAVTNKSGETVALSQLLEDKSAYRFMEELGTKPRVYYLPPVNRQYPSPDMNNEIPKS